MFDVGFSELLMTALVALVVLGPERLPKAARFAGLWVRRARAQWFSVKAELERELAAEELKRNLREPFAELQPQMRKLGESVQATANLDSGGRDDAPAAAAVSSAAAAAAAAAVSSDDDGRG